MRSKLISLQTKICNRTGRNPLLGTGFDLNPIYNARLSRASAGSFVTFNEHLLSHKNTVHYQRKPYRCQLCNEHFFTSRRGWRTSTRSTPTTFPATSTRTTSL